MKHFNALFIFGFLFISLAHGNAEKTKNIQIEITSYLGDKQVFQQGDELKFLLSLDRDAYLYVLYQTADNQLIQLIPNSNRQDNFFKADIFIEVPAESAAYQFIVSPPFGDETVYGFALDTPLSLEGKLLSNGLKRLDVSLDEIKQRVKKTAVQYYGWSYFSLTTRKASEP